MIYYRSPIFKANVVVEGFLYGKVQCLSSFICTYVTFVGPSDLIVFRLKAKTCSQWSINGSCSPGDVCSKTSCKSACGTLISRNNFNLLPYHHMTIHPSHIKDTFSDMVASLKM